MQHTAPNIGPSITIVEILTLIARGSAERSRSSQKSRDGVAQHELLRGFVPRIITQESREWGKAWGMSGTKS